MAAKKYFLIIFLLNIVFVVNSKSAFDQQLYEDVLDSEQCNHQLNILRQDPLQLQFLDASARFPSGFLTGNVNDMGDYFQCLAISEVVNQTSIEGKYCMIHVPLGQEWPDIPERPDVPDVPQFPLPVFPWPPFGNNTQDYIDRVREIINQIVGGRPIDAETRVFPVLTTARGSAAFALCIPKVCTVKETIDFFTEEYTYFNLTYSPDFCRLPNDKPFAGSDYTAMTIFSIIALFVVFSTCFDLYLKFYLKQENKRVNPLYTCFSVYTNTQRFLSFKTSPGALECIDGIRAISMLWVIIGHTYCMTLLGFIHNLGEVVDWLSRISSVWITSAPIVVDTFFMISGILAVYTTVGKMSRAKFVRSIHLFYINRLMRIFPLLATVVLLQASVFNHVSDGPYWMNVAHATENCRTYWWTALLYVQNYVNPLTICLAHSWYLSVDTQLYFICPIVLYFLFGHERVAWLFLTAFLFLALLSSSLYSFLNNYSAALANPSRLTEFDQYVKHYYFNTLTRAPPFCVGMIFGYMLYLCKDRKIRMSKVSVGLLWINSLALMAFCIFSIHPVMQIDHTAQAFDNFLNAYMRAFWALALGWLIFACVHGYGGPINWFLSLNMWKLPSRMSFAMYLVHLPLIMVINGSWVKTYYFSESLNFYKFFGDVTLTFLISFIVCITIDAPFSTLQKLLMNGGGKRPRKPPVEAPTTAEDERADIKTAL